MTAATVSTEKTHPTSGAQPPPGSGATPVPMGSSMTSNLRDASIVFDNNLAERRLLGDHPLPEPGQARYGDGAATEMMAMTSRATHATDNTNASRPAHGDRADAAGNRRRSPAIKRRDDRAARVKT